MCHENFISHSPREVELGRSDRGRRDVPKIGKRLTKRDVKPDLILSSPARRALTTAEIIAKKLDYKRRDIVVDDRLYVCAADDLLNVILTLGDNLERVMLFGHNPELTDLAHHLSSDHANVRRRRVYVQCEVVVKHRQGQARKSGARLSKEIEGQSIASVMKVALLLGGYEVHDLRF